MTLALQIQNLCKTYDNGFEALKGINLKVEQGDFYALLGANGAGKSTTIGIVSSLIRKTSGKVEIFGYDLNQQSSLAKQKLGVVPQEFNFGHFEKPFDILITQAGYYGIGKNIAQQRAEFYLEQLGLWDKRHTQARSLSGGMKRRLMIARAMMHQPQLLILDEPTAGVDIELRHSMWDFLVELNKNGTAIILTTHYLEEAEHLCRKIAIINQGEIKIDLSMKTFLSQLDIETLIFDLTNELNHEVLNTYDLNIEGLEFSLIDSNTLQVMMNKKHSLNELFDLFKYFNIEVKSMRNKSNRLEELFIHLVKQQNNIVEK